MNQQVELQPTPSPEISKQFEEENELFSISQSKAPTNNNQSFDFWCTVIFFGLVFCLICAFVSYQLSIQPPRPVNNQEPYIMDQPYQQGEQVTQTYDLIKLNTTSGLCLDGSPGSYFISRTGDPSRILLFFSGGGWCYGLDEQSTLQDCYQRSKSSLGSSSKHSPTITFSENVFSNIPNNFFRKWKKVYMNYCDGSGHQGTKKDPIEINGQKIYFRGHNITTQRFEDLERRLGLFSQAKRVVLSGLSAGGLAVFTWSNYLAQRVKKGKVYSLPDAGIFYDAENVKSKRHVYKERMANMMKLANTEIDPPNPECIKENQKEKVNCMFAQHLYKHIKIPMFPIQSTIDSWSLNYILELQCPSLGECTDDSKKAVEDNVKNITRILTDITKSPQNGAFGIACWLHGMLHINNLFISERFTIPSNSSFTLSKSIQQWIRFPNINNSHLDLKPWPSNSGCA